ncbi:hypothetical protein EDB85DRAFT_304056 [Lactarius pseudohatsudake]|nr:hypothetical protein EDB85DRAFT_304056 [Lactarius pseudohatsudake]
MGVTTASPPCLFAPTRSHQCHHLSCVVFSVSSATFRPASHTRTTRPLWRGPASLVVPQEDRGHAFLLSVLVLSLLSLATWYCTPIPLVVASGRLRVLNGPVMMFIFVGCVLAPMSARVCHEAARCQDKVFLPLNQDSPPNHHCYIRLLSSRYTGYTLRAELNRHQDGQTLSKIPQHTPRSARP